MAVSLTRRAGWAASALSTGLVALWLLLGGLHHVRQEGLRPFLENEYGNVVFALVFPVVGALLLSRTPGNRLGWLYCACGVGCSLTVASFAYAQRGLVDRPGSLPGALAAGWVSSWVWICGFTPLVTLGLLWFPTGRLATRRWSPVGAVTGLTLAAGALSVAFRPGPLENHPRFDNPLGLGYPRSWFDATIGAVWVPAVLLCVLFCLAALLMRYRRASSAERRGHRWLLVSVSLVLVSLAVPARPPVGFIGTALGFLTVPLLPASVGLVVLRDRLDDLSVPLRRSVVYGWLVAAELLLYACVVLVLDAALRGTAQPVVALLGAGAVAVLYQPLRQVLLRSSERLVYGDRGDPYAVLSRLGRQLGAATSAECALQATVSAIAEAIRVPYVAILLAHDRPEHPTAVHGDVAHPAPVTIALTHAGQDVGQLVVSRRHPREDLNQRELDLLHDLAGQVAVATNTVLLDRALRRSRDRLVLAREEERRRLRRELHDGLGPALAGVALGIDAARNVVRARAGDPDPLLHDIKDETLACVAEVRRIVDDLRPSPLDQVGLSGALRALADRLFSRAGQVQVGVEVQNPLPALPAAVEAAAYRIATEAMTNVARHANARRCRLRVYADDWLTVEVSDDGQGIPAPAGPGVGLGSMRARAAELGGSCDILDAAGGGTTVRACLPLRVP